MLVCVWFFGSELDVRPYFCIISFTDIGHQEQHPMVCHSVDGAYRVEGETWSLNNCTQCLCHVGRVLCKTHHCLPTPCPEAVYLPGQCCAVCPESTAIPGSELAGSCGAHRPHGTTWIEDNCRSCVCVNGRVSCFTQQCPNVTCNLPVLAKHQCCPMCLGKHFTFFQFLPLWSWFVFGGYSYIDTTQHKDMNFIFSKFLSI